MCVSRLSELYRLRQLSRTPFIAILIALDKIVPKVSIAAHLMKRSHEKKKKIRVLYDLSGGQLIRRALIRDNEEEKNARI